VNDGGSALVVLSGSLLGGDPALRPPTQPVLDGDERAELVLPQTWDLELAALSDAFAWSRSDNTARAYLQAIRRFWCYCLVYGLERYEVGSLAQYLYASAYPRVRYLSDLASGGKRLVRGHEPGLSRAAIDLAIAAIGRSYQHRRVPLPQTHPDWQAFTDGLRRRLKREPDRKAPMLREDLKRAVDLARSTSDRLSGLRDSAMLLLGWVCSLRRSELVGAECSHLREAPGGWVMHLPSSKTDQMGSGYDIPIYPAKDVAYDAVHACQQWMAEAGFKSGPLFRGIRHGVVRNAALNSASVRLILKRYSYRENSAGHSLRSGFCTQASMDDVSDDKICVVTRHRDRKSLQRYKHLLDARRQGPGTLL
jgi:integrase